MNSYFFKSALLPNGWQSDVRVETQHGCYHSVISDTKPQAQDQIFDVVIPQMPNIHSHVFQRAMAGLSEYRSHQDDDFWSWRDLMYHLAGDMDADRLYKSAKNCYTEMKQAGYSTVCEFHYLHRSKNDGSDYLTHSKVILKAAADVGLNITLLPVLYAYAGVGEQPLSVEQKRFELSVAEYLDLLNQLQRCLTTGQKLGVCFHSLRAVSAKQMHEVIGNTPDDWPIHIHIAEQQVEVDALLAQTGKRPVEYLYAEFEVNQRWCLVHATHLNDKEVELMAQSGAVAGLCPLTEANLGDGIFPMPTYMQQSGRFGIGSDSHIEINPAGELKMLEYSQRLALHKRNVCCDSVQPHVGTWLWLHAVTGGAQITAQNVGGIALRQQAGIINLNTGPADSPDSVLDAYVFSDWVDANPIDL